MYRAIAEYLYDRDKSRLKWHLFIMWLGVLGIITGLTRIFSLGYYDKDFEMGYIFTMTGFEQEWRRDNVK